MPTDPPLPARKGSGDREASRVPVGRAERITGPWFGNALLVQGRSSASSTCTRWGVVVGIALLVLIALLSFLKSVVIPFSVRIPVRGRVFDRCVQFFSRL